MTREPTSAKWGSGHTSSPPQRATFWVSNANLLMINLTAQPMTSPREKPPWVAVLSKKIEESLLTLKTWTNNQHYSLRLGTALRCISRQPMRATGTTICARGIRWSWVMPTNRINLLRDTQIGSNEGGTRIRTLFSKYRETSHRRVLSKREGIIKICTHLVVGFLHCHLELLL